MMFTFVGWDVGVVLGVGVGAYVGDDDGDAVSKMAKFVFVDWNSPLAAYVRSKRSNEPGLKYECVSE